jgi:hypothetical protein
MALIQLVAYCACDFLHTNPGTPDCYNVRDSMCFWFVARDDGFAIKEDIHPDYANLQHWEISESGQKYFDIDFQPSMRNIEHATNISQPFSATKNKMASRIQNAWFRAISDPNMDMCRKRLMREFSEMGSEIA